MNIEKKIAFSTAIHTGGKFGASLIGVLIIAILTRYLGVAGYGDYTTIFAYLFFFAILADLGLYAVTVNELSRTKVGEEKFFNNVFSLRFASGAALMFFAVFLVWFLPYPAIVKFGVTAAAASVFLNLVDTIVVAFFQNKLDMKKVAIAELAGKIITFMLTVLFIYFKLSLIYLILAIIVGFAGNLLINLIYLNRYIKLRLTFDRQIWQSVLKKSWPIALTTVFSLIYFKADTLLLSLMPPNPAYAATSAEAVGIYGAPYKILEVLIAWPAIFMGLVSPLLSKAWTEKIINNFHLIWQKAFDVLSIIIWPVIIGGAVSAEPLIIFVAGGDFGGSALVFRILIFAVGIIFITHLTTYSIIAIGRQREIIKYYAAGAIMALTGYVLLIPMYSYLAAAAVTVAVEGFMLVATLVILKKYAGIKIKLITFFKAMLSAAIMGLALILWAEGNIFFLLTVGPAIYFGALWLLKGADRRLLSEFK